MNKITRNDTLNKVEKRFKKKMHIDNRNNTKEESLTDALEFIFNNASNKEELDYWYPLSNLILETILLRGKLGISQRKLAEKMNTKQSAICRFENLNQEPSYKFLMKLSIALGRKIGLTLFGDYMVVVPTKMQKTVRDLATKRKTTPSLLLQHLLKIGIEKEKSNNNNLPLKGIININTKDMK